MMEFIKKNRTLVLGLLALLVVVYIWGVKSGKMEFMRASYPWNEASSGAASSPVPVPVGVTASVETAPQQAQQQAACDPANFASVSLIPEMNDVVRDKAFEFAPSPDAMLNKDFSFDSAKYGENTQGSSLRNANRQLRSEPANTRTVVSPWMNSTIEPDLLRLPLE